MRTRLQLAPDRRSATRRRELAEQLVQLADDAGVSHRALAGAAGRSQGFVSRVLAGEAHPTLETYGRLGAALGADLAIRYYPTTGPAIRDRFAAPMTELLVTAAHPRWARYLEVGVRRPSRGWIDVVLHDPVASVLLASELQSELRRLEQLIRWHGMKVESLPSWENWGRLGPPPEVSRLLVVRRTRATRQIAAEYGALLRTAYPAHPDDAVASLTSAVAWPGSALVWAIVEPHGTRFGSGR